MFTLPAAGVVVFTVQQVAPTCRVEGTFRVMGRIGRNVVEFRDQVGGKALQPGTYRISARTLRQARRAPVARLTIVVISASTPAAGEVAAARSANVCHNSAEGRSTAGVASRSGPSTARSGPTGTPSGVNGHGARAAAAHAASVRSATSRGGVLGTRIARGLKDPTTISPLILLFLGLAIALLALAALPRTVVASPAAAEVLIHRRLELALAGTAILLCVVVVYLLTV